MKGRQEMKDVDRICNRHMARLLTELEEANCPSIFVEAVKTKLAWLRADLNEMQGVKDNELVSPIPR